MEERKYMERAISLALKGTGAVNPNPLVGAVIVKNGQIIGEGWHEYYGGLHAERNAIKNCIKERGESPEGATIYVTLEPCCHYGKTPPCTEAIIENKISKVVIGSNDPNPLVAGKGVQMLKAAGIEVVTEFMKEECDSINKVFFHYIKNKTPYVVMKYAMTMDGKIATATGKSKWITGDISRKRVHEDRNRYKAIMVGVGTVLTDNPMLNCRLDKEEGNVRNPIRIICDTNLRTPLDSNVVKTANEIDTIIATAISDDGQLAAYKNNGCKITTVSQKDGHIDLCELMLKLGEMGIDGVLLEGGGTLNFSALKAGIVNAVQAYIAPKIFGGENAKSPVGGIGIDEVCDCIELKNTRVTILGDGNACNTLCEINNNDKKQPVIYNNNSFDILIESEVSVRCSQE